MTKKERVFKLLQQPSTYAGLAGVLGGVGIFGLSETLWMQIFAVVMAVVGIVATVVLDPNSDMSATKK